MHIEHIAIRTGDLERLKKFYETFFEARAGAKYVNAERGFESYFLTFPSGARLEIMYAKGLSRAGASDRPGYVHVAFSAGSQAAVDALTARLADACYRVVDGPRHTGDGYYESCVLDPDGNRIEITI